MRRALEIVAGACLARSNYGLPRPDAEEVRPILREDVTIDRAVNHLFYVYTDGDATIEIFTEETLLWISRAERRGDALLEDHPWLREVLL